MIAWIILIIVLLLLLTFPVGVDALYAPDGKYLKLKLGPFRVGVLPSKGKPKRPKQEKEPKKTEASETPAPEKKKLRLTFSDILTLAEIGLDALRRFRLHLSIDRLRLHWTAAASDPYGAVLQYGRVNEILGMLGGPAHTVFRFHEEDVRTEIDFERTRPVVEAGIVLSIQIWEILLVAVCAAAAALKWYRMKKRTERSAAQADGREEPA